jgi:hypothetical protein
MGANIETKWSRRALIVAGLAFSTAAFAQGTPATPESEGTLRLTPAQRDLIYSSISSQKHVSTAAPETWSAKVGDTVPQGVELIAMPASLAEAIPQVKGYSCAFVGGQVLIVKPDNRSVVEIIAQKA